jgi:hypothetical protein
MNEQGLEVLNYMARKFNPTVIGIGLDSKILDNMRATSKRLEQQGIITANPPEEPRETKTLDILKEIVPEAIHEARRYREAERAYFNEFGKMPKRVKGSPGRIARKQKKTVMKWYYGDDWKNS